MIIPDQYIPESKMDEQWHLDTLNYYLLRNANGSRYVTERLKEHDNYLIAQGHFDAKQFEYVTDAYGMTTPARLVNYPIIPTQLELLVGELISQPLQYTVEVINKNAIRRKNEKRTQIAAEVLLRPLRREIEQITGVPFKDEDVGEEIPEDVEKYMSMNYRDNVEIMIHTGLDFLISKYDLKQEFKRGFYDVLVCCKEFYKVYTKNGDPRMRRISPEAAIYEMDFTKEWIQDLKYFGDKNYMTVNDIVSVYMPDVETLKYLYELEKQDAGWFTDKNADFDYYIFDNNGGLRVCVIEMEWITQVPMRYKLSENKYDADTPFHKMLDDKYKPLKTDKVVTKPMNQVRFATKVGHEKLLKFGACPNQIRFEDNYANTKLNYYGAVKSLNGLTVSVVDALKNLQTLYNIVMFHIEATLQRAGGKALIYDTAQKPNGLELEDVIYHAKNSGIIPINSAQEGGQMRNYNQWSSVDLTLSNSVSQLINLKMMIEETVSKLTGINEARAGVTKSGDLVGVTQQSVMQSSLITAPLYELHYKVVGDVLNALANKMKLVWGQGEGRMVNVFGDMGYQTFKIDNTIAFDELGIFVKNSGKESQNKQMMMQMLQGFSTTGNIDPLSMVRAVNAGSATEVEAVLTKGLKEVQASQLAMKEQEMQINQQTNEINAKKMEITIEVAKINAEASIKVAEINANVKTEHKRADIIHDENMADADRKNMLDKEMLMAANAEEKEGVIKTTPLSKPKKK